MIAHYSGPLTMPHNHSLELSIVERDHTRLLRHPLFRAAKEKAREQTVSIHYDTRTLQLTQRFTEVSLRRSGSSWVQVVCYRGDPDCADGPPSEWRNPYFNQFDFSGVEDSKLRNWLSQRKISSRITPIFESSLRRAAWQLRPSPGVVVHASIDRGMLVSAGRRESVTDLDLHLVEGCPDDLFSVASQLAAHVALTPQLLTKTERGCRLFLNITPAPRKAEGFTLQSDALPLPAFRQIAFACLHHLHENHAGAVTTNDPEYIHQMRVATRRLRAALRIFKPLLPASLAEQNIPQLRDLMQNLGRARDLDVLTTEIINPVAAAMRDEPSIVALSAVITDRLYKARSDAVRALLQPGYGGLHVQATALLNRPPFVIAPSAATDEIDRGSQDIQTPPRLKEFTQDRLRNLFGKVLESAARASIDNPASLHRLRICIKRLRYAIEFFRSMLTKKQDRKMLQALVDMQEKLGKINDLAVAGEVLMACISNDPNLHQAVRLVGTWHAQRYVDLLADAAADIKKIQRLKLPRFG